MGRKNRVIIYEDPKYIIYAKGEVDSYLLPIELIAIGLSDLPKVKKMFENELEWQKSIDNIKDRLEKIR